MPIQNGKYVNPGWNNNAPPALDADELNAMSDTLASSVQPDDVFEDSNEIGDIILTRRDDLGDNWLLCNGDFVPENSYENLNKYINKVDFSNINYKSIGGIYIGETDDYYVVERYNGNKYAFFNKDDLTNAFPSFSTNSSYNSFVAQYRNGNVGLYSVNTSYNTLEIHRLTIPSEAGSLPTIQYISNEQMTTNSIKYFFDHENYKLYINSQSSIFVYDDISSSAKITSIINTSYNSNFFKSDYYNAIIIPGYQNYKSYLNMINSDDNTVETYQIDGLDYASNTPYASIFNIDESGNIYIIYGIDASNKCYVYKLIKNGETFEATKINPSIGLSNQIVKSDMSSVDVVFYLSGSQATSFDYQKFLNGSLSTKSLSQINGYKTNIGFTKNKMFYVCVDNSSSYSTIIFNVNGYSLPIIDSLDCYAMIKAADAPSGT